jgi:hypothetical protein
LEEGDPVYDGTGASPGVIDIYLANTVRERGRLQQLLLTEGATQAPVIEIKDKTILVSR